MMLMLDQLKRIARRCTPDPLWQRLRLARQAWTLSRFQPRLVEHEYGGVRFSLHLEDPLAVGWYDHDWPELEEIRALKQSRLVAGARVFDLGAHQGLVALMLASVVGPSGRVLAVELNSHNLAVARKNRESNGCDWLEMLHAAVSAHDGVITANQGLNGQIDEGRGGWGACQVAAVTIDSLARRFGSPDVVFVDIEGAECLALRGASETLRHGPDWFIEIHAGVGLEALGGSVAEIRRSFETHQYELRIAREEGAPFTSWRTDETPSTRFFLLASKSR